MFKKIVLLFVLLSVLQFVSADEMVHCDNEGCFEENFKGCKPATFNASADVLDVTTVVYYYEILGLKDGLCEVKFKFISNPNPAWIGKEMICKYDNSKDFEVAVQDMGKCEGELYKLMTGKEDQSTESVEPESQAFKTVSLCNGCMIGDSCVDEGVQKQEGDVLYYCGYGGKAFPVKSDGEVCSADYECESYNCKDGYCSALVAAEPEDTEEPVWISVVIVVVIFGVAFLLFKFGLKSKGVSKAEKKKAEKKEAWKESVKGIKQGHYTYKPELDILEKRLKEKLKK